MTDQMGIQTQAPLISSQVLYQLIKLPGTYQTLQELKFCIFDVQYISINNTEYKQNVHQKYFISNDLLRISTKTITEKKRKEKPQDDEQHLLFDS